jgi:dTDP-4-amino-4,6-dideoxygalactose transaminase
VAEDACARVVSLPLYPSLADGAQNDVVRAVLAFPR